MRTGVLISDLQCSVGNGLVILSWMLSSTTLSSDGELPHFLDAVSYLSFGRSQSRRRVAFCGGTACTAWPWPTEPSRVMMLSARPQRSLLVVLDFFLQFEDEWLSAQHRASTL